MSPLYTCNIFRKGNGNKISKRIVFEGDVYNDIIWDGIDQNTTGDANKGLYFYEITPIEYGDTRARTLVGVIFLDR